MHPQSGTKPKWTDSGLELTSDAAACFKPSPKRISLSTGDRIYRLRTNRNGLPGNSLVTSPGGDDPGSPWWFQQQTFDAITRGAQLRGGKISTAARAGLAVPKRFNPDFDTLVIYRLLRGGYAWSGIASPQLQFKNGSQLLPGGFEQLWIPGIQESEVRFEFFGSIADRL